MVDRIEPTLRTVTAGHDSVILAILLGIFIVSALCAPTIRRIASHYFKLLLRSTREPLTGERTFGERVALFICLLQTISFEGLLLFAAFDGMNAESPLRALAALAALCGILMLVQLAGYRMVGYAFANSEDTHSWQSAFFITQSLLGYMLAVPAVVVLFYPEACKILCTIGIGFYITCRIPLFISEFRIFKTDKFSLFYFFLYLCTLEIVPLLAIWQLAEFFSTLLT